MRNLVNKIRNGYKCRSKFLNLNAEIFWKKTEFGIEF